MEKRFFYYIYITGIMLGLFMLFVLMFFRNESIEADVNTGETHSDYAEELDGYISRNFAFRTESIALLTSIKARVFHSSSVDDVIIGDNGYLYYGDTVADYCGINKLDGREIYNVSRTIELMSEYAGSQGAEFLFLIAPNKNSLYDYMPYNYIKSHRDSNAARLMENLTTVRYADLHKLFEAKDEELYFKTDTHWNDVGAYYVYENIQQNLGFDYTQFLSGEYTQEKVMVGDLQNMLYPGSEPTEYRLKIALGNRFKFLTRTRSYEQAYIETYYPDGENSLLMFRDSFANNLIEYFSNTYEYAVFDKNLPYDLTQIDKYDSNVVIASIAERNLREYVTMAPVMLAPLRESVTGKESSDLCMDIEADSGEYIEISGGVNPDYCVESSNIYLKADNKMYELTPIDYKGNQYGFKGYLETEPVLNASQVSIVVVSEDNVWEQSVKLGLD